MKATGIIRRIDDLGRIVIPKEIRKTMHIRESDPLEIFTERDGDIILKKYSPMVELAAFCRTVCRGHVPGNGPDRVHHGPGSGDRSIRRCQKRTAAKSHQPFPGAGDR